MFDAGAIVGSLELDNAPFNKAVDDAMGTSQSLATTLGNIFESVGANLGGLLGGGLGEMTAGLGEALGGIAKMNPAEALGGIANVGKGAVGVVFDMFDQMDALGEAAQKTGTKVEWLSRMKFLAEESSVSLDGLVAGFRGLENQATDALAGEKNNPFEKIGISLQELRTLSGSPQELFSRVQEGIAGIDDASRRAAVAQDILGRQGMNLIPVFSHSRGEIMEFNAEMDRFGVVVTDENLRAIDSMDRLQTEWHAAMFGIQKSLAMPIIELVAENAEAIRDTFMEVAKSIRENLPGAIDATVGAFRALQPVMALTLDTIKGLIWLIEEYNQITQDLDETFAIGVKESTGAQGGVVYNNTLHVNHNAGESAGQLAHKIKPMIDNEVARQQDEWSTSWDDWSNATNSIGGGSDF